ncbi:VanW family protein [Ornithinimicrobium avium]|uniref:YoaR-like putative peptidoglycan binding domain-containing protein n=1 Tax=Ornithinimicrobium avium TaxID=2283195 RepID=A0A345NRH5_9MICO|nr:VanW family protein [Ornithinimicrobium avium]AXH97633.1 hypothetical protein DV701_17300 [Ornithinimicrobium avium]
MSDRDTLDPGLREERSTPGREWRAVVLRVLAAVLVLGGAYVAAALYFQDRPPAGMSVDGIEIGSMTREQAHAHLERELADRLEEPVTVTLVPDGGGSAGSAGEPAQISLVPAGSGLSFDIEQTLDGATGRSFDPRVLWAHVSGQGQELDLVGAVDEQALDAALQSAAKDYDEDAVEGKVSLGEDGEDGVSVEDPRPGRRLDVPATAAAVEAAWPASTQVEGTAALVRAKLSAKDLERFRTEEVEPALAAPVKVTAVRGKGDGAKRATAEIAPRELAELLTVRRGQDDALSLELDQEALLARVRQDLGQLERGPRDATVRLAGSDVEVVPARAGTALVEDGLTEKISAALSATGKERTVRAELRAVEPAIPTSVSQGWSFTQMASFTSQFPTGAANAERTANLHAGVEHLDGTVVMPGQQFSLGAALGDISEAGGYHEAPIIVEGRLVMGIGGGLSQISTVVFNTSWLAGVQLDAHTPHSYYIPRYPAGREATLALPGLDNLWTNDTDNPVVLRAWISGDVIHMVFLGDRQYTVTTLDSERYDRTQGERVEDDSAECVPQHASDGFTIVSTRILSQGGTEVSRDSFTTVYQPADEIVCTNPQAGY